MLCVPPYGALKSVEAAQVRHRNTSRDDGLEVDTKEEVIVSAQEAASENVPVVEWAEEEEVPAQEAAAGDKPSAS